MPHASPLHPNASPTRAPARRAARASAAALALALSVALAACTPGAPHAPAASPTSGAASAAPIAPSIIAPVIPTGAPATLDFPTTGTAAVGIAHPDGTVDLLGEAGTMSTGINPAATPADTVPIASITKVITSLVVLDAHPLADPTDQGPTLTLRQPDLDTTAVIEAEGQFTEPMYDGQQVTLHDALAVTLLTSANNYAESVAAWAFGSQAAYLDAARAWLTEHGLTGTTLADASGLDPGSASTPADLLRVAALAHADPALAAIAGLATYDQTDLGTIANQNILLGENGVDGLKTGSTGYAGFTLLTSAVVTVGETPVTLVAVVLGTESLDARFDTTRALLTSAQAGLTEVPLATAGQSFGSYATDAPTTATSPAAATTDAPTTTSSPAGPASAAASAAPETTPLAPPARQAVAADSLTAPVFADTPVTVAVTLDPLTPDALATAASTQDPVGTATFTAGETSWTVPLVIAP